MAVNFRLAYNSGTQFVDLFPRTNMAAVETDNLLQYTTIDVTIPAPSSATTTQSIAITPTTAQVNAPVYMMLTSTGTQAQQDYATITQYEVTTNALVITRLYSQPSGSINVTLIFEEGVV